MPDGFVVTTEAYARAVHIDDVLASTGADLAAAARARVLAAPPPDELVAAVRDAYAALGAGAVAVRSSATAEDLPFASFAGQQDTFLNVSGADAVLDAIRRCWASLWNERAVAYREANGVDHRTVRLAVVVQRMVDAVVAGVLFTADPLTGRRRRAVIEAVSGLGERLVSGAANPDRFVVEDGAVLERRGETLSDAQARELAATGRRVEARFGAPQDIEWAIDRGAELWLVQSRPITTLYPLPPNAPDPARDLRVYFSANVAQGVFAPLTPMGLQAFRLLSSAIATLAGLRPRDPVAGVPIFIEAGERLFLDVTELVRDPLVRRVLPRMGEQLEARSGALTERLVADPRLAPRRRSALATLAIVAPRVARTGLPLHAARAFLRPDATRGRVARWADGFAFPTPPPGATARERLATFERVLLETPPRLMPPLAGVIFGGLGSHALAGRLARDVATRAELQTVLRGLPHNPTTEMDLALWALAQRVRADPAAAKQVREWPAVELAAAYRAGTLPRALQEGLGSFLAAYGHRAVAEIDLGVPRWGEDPTHLLNAVANYLRLEPGVSSPDAQFARGAQEAEAMARGIVRRVARRSRVRALALRALFRRARSLAGMREALKFHLVRLLAHARSLLWPVGEELARAGRIEAAADVFFLTLPDAYAALDGADVRGLVGVRRAAYARERRRRRVPRILLSDGTEPEMEAVATEGALVGTPASPGLVTAAARVVMEPHGARLEPGEILVAPSTDPGWTPLFLTAGGLVMEMGGMMSHGAVVAREYGIPAVVGVAGATERIATGDRVTVDGSAGTVTEAEG